MEGNILILVSVFYPMLGALLTYLIGRKYKTTRDYLAQGIVLAEFLLFVIMAVSVFSGKSGSGIWGAGTTAAWKGFCGFGMSFTLDGFRLIHGLLASFLWLAATVFSREYLKEEHNRNRFYFFLLVTLGATVGVFLSADLYTTFIFFELMSFTSFVWVIQEERKESIKAAKTYLTIGVLGGLVMLMGLFLLFHLAGTLQMDQIIAGIAQNMQAEASLEERKVMLRQMYIAGGCLLFGFGAKAGMFGLHVWLPDSYTYAPAPASALLSGMLSKTGLYGIIVVTCNLFLGLPNWGMLVVTLGLLTMAVGAVLAVFSINMKRILACSSMSQIGFMLVGIGMCSILGKEGTLAARGTVLHMMNHSIIKLVLFIIAGMIVMHVGKLDLNAIRGYGRKKPFLHFIFLMSALGIGGVPLWNGYISKTLLHESILEGMGAGILTGNFLQVTEWIFLISGGFTVAYMAKMYISIFWENNQEEAIQQEYDAQKGSYIGKMTAVLLGITAMLMPVLGMLPGLLTDKIADAAQGIMNVETLSESIQYFSMTNIKGGMISLAIGVVVYIGFVRICLMHQNTYVDYWPKWMNIEEKIYRPVILGLLPVIGGLVSRVADSMVDAVVVFLRMTIMKDEKLPFELEEGSRFTYHAGHVTDWISNLYHKVTKRRKKDSVSYAHKFAVTRAEIAMNNVLIGRSLSFGLLLFCIGLCVTLIYVLIR